MAQRSLSHIEDANVAAFAAGDEYLVLRSKHQTGRSLVVAGEGYRGTIRHLQIFIYPNLLTRHTGLLVGQQCVPDVDVLVLGTLTSCGRD